MRNDLIKLTDKVEERSEAKSLQIFNPSDSKALRRIEADSGRLQAWRGLHSRDLL